MIAFITLFLVGSSSAMASPTPFQSLRCTKPAAIVNGRNQAPSQNTDDEDNANFIEMTLQADGTYNVRTEITERFIMGLSCTFHESTPLLFLCRNNNGSRPNVSLYSGTRKTAGYFNGYEYEDKEFFIITYSTYAQLPNGRSKEIKHEFTFEPKQCEHI